MNFSIFSCTVVFQVLSCFLLVVFQALVSARRTTLLECDPLCELTDRLQTRGQYGFFPIFLFMADTKSQNGHVGRGAGRRTIARKNQGRSRRISQHVGLGYSGSRHDFPGERSCNRDQMDNTHEHQHIHTIYINDKHNRKTEVKINSKCVHRSQCHQEGIWFCSSRKS